MTTSAIYDHPDSAHLVDNPAPEAKPTRQPLSAKSVPARTDDPYSKVYTSRASQELHFNRKDVYEDPTRSVYTHPSSQEKLFFPDDPSLKQRGPETPVNNAEPVVKQPDEEPAQEQQAPDYSEVLSGHDDAIKAAEQTADADAVALLTKSKTEAAAILTDYGVSADEAKALTGALQEYSEPMEQGPSDQQRDSTMTYLRWLWGDQADGKLKAAVEVANEACTRLPWLRDVLANGAGNDLRVIQRFAAAAERKRTA